MSTTTYQTKEAQTLSVVLVDVKYLVNSNQKYYKADFRQNLIWIFITFSFERIFVQLFICFAE